VLPSSHRLRSGRDIARVYRQGAYGAGGGVLSVKAAPSGLQVRAVVVVGKKIDKRAVIRNRLRRRLIEAFRGQLTTVRPGYDIVITVHSNFSDLSAEQLGRHLATALSRARVTNQSNE
jgi:ribonuclease P protein component